MLNAFKSYYSQNKLFNETDKIIIAVSGGIDSVVLLDLLSKCHNQLSIAHCNFHLRGKESDDDQIFVEHLAVKYNLPVFTKSFQTSEYVSDKGISIQMAARELRYGWFKELLQNKNYQYIAVAHNLNDVIETVLINLCRGTGLHGISGMKPKNNKVIRPLLFAKRKQIEEYCKRYKLEYREDSSNAETKYTRNLIRHKIIPEFEKINTGFIDKMNENIAAFNQLNEKIIEVIQQFKNKYFYVERGIGHLSIHGIIRENFTVGLLFELLYDYGFNYDTVINIYNSLEGEPGRIFYSEKYQIIKDREFLLITKKEETNQDEIIIQPEQQDIINDVHLTFTRMDRNDLKNIPKESKFAVLDSDKIKYPLKLRCWKEGDYFYPLGMKQKKKLSDYFVDNKFSLLDKQNCRILESDGNIIWIVGSRIDNRYKILPETKNILLIELHGNNK